MLRKRLWSQPQPSDPASEAPQWGLEICHFLQHQMILEAIKLLEPLPRRKHTLGNGNATTEYIPVFKPVFKHGYGCYKKQNIHLIVEKKKHDGTLTVVYPPLSAWLDDSFKPGAGGSEGQ